MPESARNLMAATFSAPDGGSRAAAAIGGAMPDKVGNTAVLYVQPNGKAKFTESKDWGAGRGALLGGAIGIIGGPVGMLAAGGIGALTSKLRDSGFKNDELERLGATLGPNSSAVVVEIASDAVKVAEQIVQPLGVEEVVVQDVDANVANLFDEDDEPTPDSNVAASPSS
jgi:uncharacterized membrane protein